MAGAPIMYCRCTARDWLFRLIAISAGITIACGIVEWTLRRWPSFLPAEVRVNPPVRRIKAHGDRTYAVRLSDGDLFHWLGGQIAPIGPAEDTAVQVRFVTDGHGFRNSGPEGKTYDVVAIGDLFTVGASVATPWPQAFAAETGRSVLNLGESGVGPTEALSILERYGLPKEPRWAVLGYFEGNDLRDVGETHRAVPLLIARVGHHIYNSVRTAAPVPGAHKAAAVQNETEYRFPVSVRAAGRAAVKMAFFPFYVSWLALSREAIATSRNYTLLKQQFERARGIAVRHRVRAAILYIPSKAHVYLDLIQDSQAIGRVLQDLRVPGVDQDGYLDFAQMPISIDLIREHADDQRDLVSAAAARHNLAFIDLTAHFRTRAREGELLYYPYDTHWNQAGHDLAAKVLAAHLERSELR